MMDVEEQFNASMINYYKAKFLQNWWSYKIEIIINCGVEFKLECTKDRYKS